jgi:hypothetical protein
MVESIRRFLEARVQEDCAFRVNSGCERIIRIVKGNFYIVVTDYKLSRCPTGVVEELYANSDIKTYLKLL